MTSEILGSVVEYWHWWVLGILLAVIEVFAPSTFFLWVGISAILTGAILWMVPSTPFELQLLAFAMFSVASVAASRMYLRSRPIESDDPTLNRRGEQYIGRVYVLEEAIANGRGKVRVGDSIWMVEGDDMPAGEKVRVTDISGITFIVEAADGQNPAASPAGAA